MIAEAARESHGRHGLRRDTIKTRGRSPRVKCEWLQSRQLPAGRIKGLSRIKAK